jgi:phytoene dehydrogenase-like protein
MPKKVDAIVIGAGLSGSILGAYLAKGGLKTIVFEATDHIGGPKYQSYTVNVFRSDLTHIPYWGMRWNGSGGWWVKAAEELGASIAFQCLPNAAFYVGGKIVKMPYCTDGKAFLSFMKVMIPFPLPESTESALTKIFDEAVAMPESQLWSEDMDTTPAKAWIDSITDDDTAKSLMATLSGMQLCLPPDIALERVCARMVAGAFLSGLFGARVNMTGIVGGAVDEIPKAFCKVTTDHGGQVLLNHRVNKVIVEDGKAKGVVVSTTGTEETYEAEHVIVGTEYASYKKLLGKDLPRQIEKTINAFDGLHTTSLDVHFGLKWPVFSPWYSYLGFVSDAGEFTHLIASIPHFDPAFIPQGKQLFQIQTFKPTPVFKMHSPEEWTESLLDMTEKVFPELRAAIEWTHATVVPQPFQYQFVPVPKIPYDCPGIANLHFTGDCTPAPGFVTDRAAASAMIVAQKILKSRRK